MQKETKQILIIIAIFIVFPIIVLSYMFINEKKSIEFKLKGPTEITLNYGDKYEELGFVAKSDRRNLQNVVTINSDLDIKKVGDYTIQYNLIVKILGIKKILKRNIHIIDTIKPVLTITSSKDITYIIGDKFKYPTYEASDNYDGNLTNKVVVDESSLKLDTPGTYEINYSVADSSQNSTSDKVKVTVKKKISAYIDVSISKQTLTLYEEDNIVLTSPIVTGNTSAGNGTPTGNYKVLNKARNVTLKGADYESFVNYWIAFIGHSYGMHDASWRSNFGGEIYKTNGSHGCINMPYNKVKELYERVEVGTPVYVH